MNRIYIIREGREVICAYDTMAQGVTAAINRLVICGYLCEKIRYGEHHTEIAYSIDPTDEIHVMHIEEIVHHKEEV